MIPEGNRLTQLSNALVLDDGDAVAFRVEREHGQTLDLACDLALIGDIFAFLGTLAKAAGVAQGKEAPAPSRTYNYLVPIPAVGIGFQPGPRADETMIVIRLTGFDVAYSVPNNALAEMADGIARTARTLSASAQKPQ